MWHLCSLDAPTVAALWVSFIGRAYGVSLPWSASVSMFVAVWMLYAADRLLDTRNQTNLFLEERHHFHHRYRHLFLVAIGISSLTLAGFLIKMAGEELRLFAALGSLLLAYSFLIHLWPLEPLADNIQLNRLPKELAVGLFFPAAVFIPTVSRAFQHRAALLSSAVSLALVCTLNCLYIFVWEHPDDRSEAHWTTQFATRNIRRVSMGMLCACLLVAAVAPWLSGISLSALACAFAVGTLVALNRVHDRIAPLALRASADLALLSPLLIAPLMMLRK